METGNNGQNLKQNMNKLKDNNLSMGRLQINILVIYFLFLSMGLVNIHILNNITSGNKLISLFLTNLIISYIFFYFLISTVSSYYKFNVLYKLLNNKLKFSSLVLSLDVTAILILLWITYCKDSIPSEILLDNSHWILVIIICLTLVLLKSTIVDLLNFKMHKNNYELRLDEHLNTGSVLKVLHSDTGITDIDSPEIRGQKIFKKISSKQIITKENLLKIYDEDVVESIFETFNLNHDHKITENEFVSTYKKIIKQRYDLLLSLDKKDDLLRKFDLLLACIFVPLGFVIYEICINMSFDKISILRYFQTLLSLSFIFGALAQDIFKSLNYILNVRIFDVGDFLEMDDKIYIVKDIGLLFSTFEVDSKSVIIANSKLMSNDIINYRLTKEKKSKFVFNILTEIYHKNELNLRTEIRNLISGKRAYMTRKFDLHILDQSEDTKMMRICVSAVFKLSYQNIYQIQNEENDFLTSLAKIIKSLKNK